MSFKKEILIIVVYCTIIFVGCGKKTDENVETSKASELTTENVKNKVTEDILETGIDELIYPADKSKDCLNTVGYELKDINNDDTDEPVYR